MIYQIKIMHSAYIIHTGRKESEYTGMKEISSALHLCNNNIYDS